MTFELVNSATNNASLGFEQAYGLYSDVHILSESIVPTLIKNLQPHKQLEFNHLSSQYCTLIQPNVNDALVRNYVANPHVCMVNMDAYIQTIMAREPIDKYHTHLVKVVITKYMPMFMQLDGIMMKTAWLAKIMDLIPVDLLKLIWLTVWSQPMRNEGNFVSPKTKSDDAIFSFYLNNRVTKDDEIQRHAAQLMSEHFHDMPASDNTHAWPSELSNLVGSYLTRVITRASPIFPRPCALPLSTSLSSLPRLPSLPKYCMGSEELDTRDVEEMQLEKRCGDGSATSFVARRKCKRQKMI